MTTCDNTIYGAPRQSIFLGASVQSFQASLGWNEQASNLSVTLVEDECFGNKIYYDENMVRQSGVVKDPGFLEPAVGTPVYFRIEGDPDAPAGEREGFEYAGIVQSWTKSDGAQGNTYNVNITDPRQILENTQVIVGEYAGGVNVANLVNAYAFSQSQGDSAVACEQAPFGKFGGKTDNAFFTANDRGMTWNDLKCALQTLLGTINADLGNVLHGDFGPARLQGAATSANNGYGAIPEVGSSNTGYAIDLTEIPFAPVYYRVTGPIISLMDLISQVCEDAGCDFFIELLANPSGGGVGKVIKVRVSQRTNQQPVGRIQEYIDSLATANNGDSVAISQEIGRELGNEPTSVFLIGAKEKIPLVQTNLSMLPYFGLDNQGNLTQAAVVGGEYRVRIDVSRLNASLYTSFGSNYIWVSESEFRAALGDMDAWKHVTLAQGLDVATHFATIKQQKFLDAVKIDRIAKGIDPAHDIGIPNIESTSNEMDPSSDSAKDLTKIYEFIKSFADEFYGKQFVVASPEICYVQDQEDGEYLYSHDPSTEGCWVTDDTESIIGLEHNTSASDFFRSDDGRYQPIVRYPINGSSYVGNSGLIADPSELGDENYLTNGTYIWQKADIEPKLIFGNPINPANGVPGVVIKVGARVSNRTSDDEDDAEGVDQPQGGADFLAKKAGGDGLKQANIAIDRSAFSLSMIGNAISPDVSLVPLTSNVTVYGPWSNPGNAGGANGTRAEKDESYAPWEFGSDVLMNSAAVEKVTNAAAGSTYAERGSITIAGFPNQSLGDSIGQGTVNRYAETRSISITACTSAIASQFVIRGGSSDGVNVTNISCTIGPQGFTTTYQFSTYTPRFGRFDKDNADRLKRIGKNRLSANRDRRAKFAVAELITRKVSALRKKINEQIGKTARAPKSANHMLIGRILPSGDRTESFTMNVKEATVTFPSDNVYANTALMSMDGFLRPVSKAGDGGLPRFVIPSGDSCSGNAALATAPDGPRLTYSGISVNQEFLDPLSNPNEGASTRDSAATPSGHDIEILGRNTSAPPSGFAIPVGEEVGDGGYADDYRFFAMRGPIMLHGWGYDTAGKPVPNAADDEGATTSGIFETGNLQDQFLAGYLKKQRTWPVAPVDLRLDRKRGVWTVPPPPRNLHVSNTGCISGTGAFVYTVDNGAGTFDSAGSTVDEKLNAYWPWDIKAPSGIGKIPAYYDSTDCKYYAFPVNRFDAEVSGIGGFGVVGNTQDVKKIVFASGFSGVFNGNDTGCERTLYVYAQQGGGSSAQYRWAGWGTGCNTTGLDCDLTGVTNCTTVACLEFSTGLVFDGTGVTAFNFAANITGECDGGGAFSSITGACFPWTNLLAGSGISITGYSVSGCGTKVARLDAQIPITGSQIGTCVGPLTRGAEAGGFIGPNKLRFDGFLSTEYDSSACEYVVTSVQQSLFATGTPWCGRSQVSSFRFTGIEVGRGLEIDNSGCVLAINSTLRSYGFEIADECDPETRSNAGTRYHEGFRFVGDLSSTYDAANCTVQVSGVKPSHRFKNYGYGTGNPCRSDGLATFVKTNTAVGSGLNYRNLQNCTGLLETEFYARGYTENQYQCSTVPDPSFPYFSKRFTDIVFGSGFKIGYDSTNCRIHVNSALIGSGSVPAKQSPGGGCGSLPDYTAAREGEFKNLVHAIKVTGALGATFDSDGCTMILSGLTNQAIRTAGFTSPCDQSVSTAVDYESSGINFGAGIRTSQNSNCGTLVESPLYFWGSGECSNPTLDDVEPVITTGVRIGSGLRLSVLDQALCTVRLDSNMIISGWDEYLNTDVKTNYTTLVITGNLALNSPATPYADDCTVLLSGIASPEVTSGIYIYQTGVCGATTGVTNKVTKIAYGSGLSVDFLNNNATGIVKLDFKIGGDESGCFAQVKNTYNATGITFGSGLKVGYTECGNVHVNSQFGAAGSSSECFTSLTNYRNITGITFGTGLSVTNTDCGLHVNSRFYISGDPDGCRGEYYSKSNLTGLLIGRGLRAVNDSAACATKLTTNIYASGSSDDTTINVKTRDWDAIQFTGNLRLIDDGCKVLVSGYGTQTLLAVTGLGSCNGSDYFKDTTVSRLGFRKGLFVQDDGVGNPIVDSIFYVEGTTDTVGCGKLFSPQNVTGIKFGNGLELANGDTNECNLVVRSKFGVVGETLTDCGDVTASAAEAYITGLDFRNGLSLTTDGCNAIISGTPNFRVGGIAGTCGGTDVDHRIVSGIQFGTGLLLSDPNSCDATVNLNFKAGGDTSECFNSVSVTENITGITFGTGLRVGADGCNLHVNSRFFISGSDAACRGTKTTGHHITGLLVGVGLSETDNGNCQSVIDLNLSASGSSTLGGSVSKIVGWDAIQFTGNLTVESVDPCTIRVSGVDPRIPVTGSTNPCSPSNDTVEDSVAGFVFGTGLKTTALSDGSVHVNSRFYTSGEVDACRGQELAAANTTGLLFGRGLVLDDTAGGCARRIRTNIYASGSTDGTTVDVRESDWDAIQFVGNLRTTYDAGECKVTVSGTPPTIAVTGSNDPCTWSKTLDTTSVNGFVFGTGLKATEGTDSTVHINSRFYASGNGGVCGGTYTDGAHITGIVAGKGLKVTIADCTATLENSLRGFTSGTCGGSDTTKTEFVGLAAGTGLSLTFDGCTGILTNAFTVAGQLDKCVAGAVSYGNAKTTSKLRFGSGLITGVDNSCEVTVAAVPFKLEGVSDKGCGTSIAPFTATGIKFGSGLRLYPDSCGGVLRVDSQLYGTDKRSGGNYTVNGSGFVDLEIVGSLSTHIDGCKAVISGLPSITVTGSTNPCTLGADTVVNPVAGITFSSGLKTITSADGVSVSAPFSVSGVGGSGSCRGEYFSQATTTGLIFGKGLKASEDVSCASLVEFNVAASGGPGTTKLQGWDAIEFTGNLTVTSEDDGCTIRVSGSNGLIPATGSSDPCTPANDTTTDALAGLVFGTGLQTTKVGEALHVNSRFYVSGDGSVCGGTWATAEITSGIKVGAGLKATNAGCVSDIELNFNARQAAKCGSAAGTSSQISALTFGTGLNFTTNGCTGVIISDITVDGSTFSDPCDVGSRSNAFANKRFENIDFAGYLSSAIDGCNVIVSGRKSPINAGNTAASLFEAINLIAGTGVTITSSGTCNAVINSTAGTISVTGSSDSCTDARDVTVGSVETFIFGTGLRTTALGDAVLIDSPLTVAGRPITDSCTSPPTEGASFDGQLNNITFTGYLSATQTDCSVVVEGTRSPITIAKSGTFCGTESSESGEVQTLNLGTGLQVDINGCSATLRTDLKVGAAASCGGGAVTPGIFQTLEFGTGFVVNEKAGEECTWQINSDFNVSGKTSCSGDSYVSVPNVSNLVFGNGMTVSDDGSCQVTVSSEKKIGGGGSNGCLGSPEGTTVDYDTLLVSGLGLSVEGCTATISGPKMLIEQEAVCNRSAVDPFPYQSITVSTGLYLTESSCGATLTAGVKVNHYEPDCNGNSQTANYFTGIVAGRGLNVGGGGNSCSVSIDAGLSGVRSGSNIRGQFTNCGNPSNATLTSNSCISDGDNAQANRGIPEQIRGIWTGPGIGASIGTSTFGGNNCEEDTLLLFANNAVSGLGGTCGTVNLGLQVYTSKYSNVFSIGGTNGLDLLTNAPVDGATFSHGYNIRLNEGGGNWSCTVVTGIEVTKNGSYVTDVQPLNGTFGGSVSCEESDATSVGLPGEEKKFWLKAVPCVT